MESNVLVIIAINQHVDKQDRRYQLEQPCIFVAVGTRSMVHSQRASKAGPGLSQCAVTERRTMRNEGPVHATAAVDLLRRHAVPSLPPLILWMLGGGQGLLTRSGFFVSPHLKP